jgi:dihydroxy-acid dehydratase
VQNGDEIRFDGPQRVLELLVPEEILAARARALAANPPAVKHERGYYQLYVEHVLQADQGCDFDFLVGASGSVVERESH